MEAIEASTASQIQLDYMKLLVTQLRNQNPLEPMDNNEMASQLAQFSQLSQLETMNSSFSQALQAADRTYANSLIGKEVSFLTDDSGSETDVKSGKVDKVINDGEGSVLLQVGDYLLGLDGVISVNNPQA
ncbi:MAG: flagellar hook capping FlgD N-terminal domain-containing protein [Sedimentisphaerales bacterium]|jgi:flagellar basal-body rod modification protein FlgD